MGVERGRERERGGGGGSHSSSPKLHEVRRFHVAQIATFLRTKDC